MSTTAREPEALPRRPVRPLPAARALRAVVARGLRDNRRAPLTWGGALGVMGGVMALIWPSIESSIGELMRSYPENLRKAFDIQSLDTVEKYIDAEMLSLIVPLALGFFAIRCVTRPLVGAEREGWLDTVLALPVSRRVLVAASFIVAAASVAAILFVSWALTWLVGTVADTGISATKVGAGFLNVWPLSVAFAGLAVLLSGVLHRPATVTAIGAGTLLGMYVIDLLGKLSSAVEPYRVVSAFHWYGSAINNGLDLGHMVGLTLVGCALAAAGAVLFDRRDVR
jgi:ABC-2 type transport system permease protein